MFAFERLIPDVSCPAAKDLTFRTICRAGLRPEIQDIRNYSEITSRDNKEALTSALEERLLMAPSIRKILRLHDQAFRGVAEWAGTFRSADESVVFGKKHYTGAPASRIEPELRLAIQQTKTLLKHGYRERESGPDLCPAIAIAFFHIRFERIHPFRDGNGRLGRIILAAQMYEAFGTIAPLPIKNREEYFKAMDQGHSGNLKPLANLILKAAGSETIKKSVKSPFVTTWEPEDSFYTYGKMSSQLDVISPMSTKSRRQVKKTLNFSLLIFKFTSDNNPDYSI